MAATKNSTRTAGVRYRLHTSRKYGVGFDRYFFIRYRVDGKLKEEGLGWSSEGWSEKKAAAVLAELKANITLGTGPATLQEKRDIRLEEIEEQKRLDEQERTRNISFSEVWETSYYPFIQANRTSQRAIETEETLYRLWIRPVIGDIPLLKIATLPHMESIKRNMKKAGRSARTIRYALDVVRQVFNHANLKKIYSGQNPAAGKRTTRPRKDNRRNRFLTTDESELLLKALWNKSVTTHDMALLSLRAGLRFGELASLKWGDLDIFTGLGTLKDTKSGENRTVFLTDDVKVMLSRRRPANAKPTNLVFPDQNGNQIKKISKTFVRAIDELGLNNGVEDPREKVVFHTLRRTFATWLLRQGTNIYYIQKLLGHADISTTTRYLDADTDALQNEVMKLQNNS